eukprot:GHVR01014059.1.p2 GENE.GHVR01014059.1~~GHVR01014059.1.p2  ORF type:complete len:121 (-),score=3.22 GHVR01014059.1:287-649(-)
MRCMSRQACLKRIADSTSEQTRWGVSWQTLLLAANILFLCRWLQLCHFIYVLCLCRAEEPVPVYIGELKVEAGDIDVPQTVGDFTNCSMNYRRRISVQNLEAIVRRACVAVSDVAVGRCV